MKGSPFRRLLDVLLRERAIAFTEAHNFPSPIQPEHITPKLVRLALQEARHHEHGPAVRREGP